MIGIAASMEDLLSIVPNPSDDQIVDIAAAQWGALNVLNGRSNRVEVGTDLRWPTAVLET